jgi:thiamine biosynthesis lipoprotein
MNDTRPVTRRRVLQIIASAGGLACTGNLHAALTAPASVTHSWRGVALGARASITIRHHDPENARRLLQRCIAEIRRLEDVLSLYRQGTAITALNRQGYLDHPPPDLVHVLSLARSYGDVTKGAFDPTVQPLWTLYASHFARPAAHADGPDQHSIDRVRAMVDYRNMSIATRRIALAHPGMGITLNGIAQGYITDRVTDLLRNEGLDDMLVDLGEIRALGRHSDSRPWTVGVKDPTTDDAMETLTVENQAVATSAGAATRFEETGRHHHLFDPRTGESTRQFRGITVIAPTATTADALSTGFASMDLVDVENVLRRYPSVTARVTTHTGEVLTLSDNHPL